MTRLTDEERDFRKAGAGVPLSRWWPIPLTVIGLGAAISDPFLFTHCFGVTLPIAHGRALLVEVAMGGVCSPMLITGGPWEWLWLALIWVPMPFAVINARWMRRHAAYWKEVRAHEAELRRERKARKKAQGAPGEPPATD